MDNWINHWMDVLFCFVLFCSAGEERLVKKYLLFVRDSNQTCDLRHGTVLKIHSNTADLCSLSRLKSCDFFKGSCLCLEQRTYVQYCKGVICGRISVVCVTLVVFSLSKSLRRSQLLFMAVLRIPCSGSFSFINK